MIVENPDRRKGPRDLRCKHVLKAGRQSRGRTTRPQSKPLDRRQSKGTKDYRTENYSNKPKAAIVTVRTADGTKRGHVFSSDPPYRTREAGGRATTYNHDLRAFGMEATHTRESILHTQLTHHPKRQANAIFRDTLKSRKPGSEQFQEGPYRLLQGTFVIVGGVRQAESTKNRMKPARTMDLITADTSHTKRANGGSTKSHPDAQMAVPKPFSPPIPKERG